jgi:CRP-like cAMP-binding protein
MTRERTTPSDPPLQTCENCNQRGTTEWCVLKDAEITLLSQYKICNTYQAGQIIFYQGNACLGVHCVSSGSIVLRKMDAQGNSVVTRVVNAGETLGYRAFFSGKPYSSTAEAVDACKVCFVDRVAVKTLLERNPLLGLSFLKRLSDDVLKSEDILLEIATLPVRVRFAHLLLTLKERLGTMSSNGTWLVRLPLSRQDIASLLCVRPETLARTIAQLEEDNVAVFNGKDVKIADLDKLLDEVEHIDV